MNGLTMRHLRWCDMVLCLCIIGLLVVANQPQAQNSVDLQAAYEQEQYQIIVDTLEQQQAAGISNGALHYNLALAYEALNEDGRAMLHALKSAQYMPRDTDLNLLIARLGLDSNNLTTGTSDALTTMATLSNNLFTVNELSYLAFLAWVILFGLAIAYRLRHTWRDTLRILLVATGTLFMVTIAVLASRVTLETVYPAAVVLNASAQVYSGPGDDYLRLYELYGGAEIRLINHQTGWTRFTLPDGRQGWIENDKIARVKD